jgi:putative transposase
MKNRHSVEQIIRILGEIERAGLKISDACRPHGISEQTYYRWRNKYGGMEITEARKVAIWLCFPAGQLVQGGLIWCDLV